MSASHIVIENPTLDARSVCAPEALSAWEARGWVALGGTSDPARDPIRTDAEQAAHDAAEAERIAALLAPKSDEAPAPSRPRK